MNHGNSTAQARKAGERAELAACIAAYVASLDGAPLPTLSLGWQPLAH
jgi:hypothetical protein